jgi:hypothetical protein
VRRDGLPLDAIGDQLQSQLVAQLAAEANDGLRVGRDPQVGLFWPDFETEGFDQAMEFASGFLGMLEVAADWQANDVAPTARPTPRGGAFSEDVTVVFETSEPATIHYTTDGSRPTTASPTLGSGGQRSTTPVLRLDTTTTVRWLTVDAAGNTGDVGSAR